MKLDKIFNKLVDAFKIPETKEDAIEYIKKDPSCLTLVEEMAFRQVVINILVAANIVSEEDFNDSVSHFKDLFIDKFADELLEKIKAAETNLELEDDDDDDQDYMDDDDDDFDDWLDEDEKCTKPN